MTESCRTLERLIFSSLKIPVHGKVHLSALQYHVERVSGTLCEAGK